MLIGETWLNNKQSFKIADYTVYRTDHSDHMTYGGAAVLIKKNLPHTLKATRPSQIKNTTDRIHLHNHKINIAVAHCSPNKNIQRNNLYITAVTNYRGNYFAW